MKLYMYKYIENLQGTLKDIQLATAMVPFGSVVGYARNVQMDSRKTCNMLVCIKTVYSNTSIEDSMTGIPIKTFPYTTFTKNVNLWHLFGGTLQPKVSAVPFNQL